MSKPLPSPDGTPMSYYDEQSKPAPSPSPEAVPDTMKPIETPPEPPQPPVKPYLRRGQPIRVLTVIDVYGWAYDEGRRGLYRELAKRHPDWILDTASLKEVVEGRVNPKTYDVTLVWCWFEVHGSHVHPYMSLLTKLNMTRSVLCVAGMYVLPLLSSLSLYLRDAFYMAGNNSAIADALRRRSRYTRVYTLEYGVDLERFQPTPLPPVFTVGWAGHQGRPLKRWSLAEEIMKQVDAPLRVAGHISSSHYVPSSDMPAWYDGNTVQLITSDSEAHPLVYYEAMAKGRIPVSTLVGDISSTAEDGVNGFYLPVDAPPEAYATKLNLLKADPTLQRHMSAAARRSVEEKWRWSRVADSYEQAIMEVSGAYTCSMLVSRTDDKLAEAAQSVLERHPWEMRVYIDPVTLKPSDQAKAERVIRGLHRLSPETEIVINKQKVTPCEDHHDDVTRAVHTGILEAKYNRVLWVDDDDVMLVDPADLLYRMGDGIGIVYGNVIQLFNNNSRVHRHGEPIKNPLDMANMKGSVVLYNRDAFKQVYKNIDAQKPRGDDPPRDYGYFWDYKIGYWLMRAGYVLRYYNADCSIQNVNPNPGEKRIRLYNDWPQIVQRMDGEPLVEA